MHRGKLRLAAAAVAFVVVSCGPAEPEPEPATRTYTFRALAGVSMGGMGTGFVGSRNPDRFDALGMLGGPMDFAYLLDYMRTQHLGGFCAYDELVALVDAHPGDTALLDDPAATAACVRPEPTRERWEHGQSFNHWWFDDNGGTFDRSAYVAIFEDLAFAFGNPQSWGPEDTFLPPGIPEGWSCAEPVSIPGTDRGGAAPVYNAEHNPEGRFDVVTVCDGEEPIYVCEKSGVPVDFCAAESPDVWCGDDGPSIYVGRDRKRDYPDAYYGEKGRYDPCRDHGLPMRVALAVDFDGDGERDYGEPILINDRERFLDVGTDGCPSSEEDGAGGCSPGGSPYDPVANPDPNGDDYAWDTNPLGTEGSRVHEEGEPFDDLGLDGVAGTRDHGEGNGVYDLSPNLERWFEHDPRTNLRTWTDAQLRRIDFWFDGGIRDIFNFGVSSAQVFGLTAALTGDSAWYERFSTLPRWDGRTDTSFDWQSVDWEALPRSTLVMYGDPDATEAAWRNGDGAHVGTVEQAIARFHSLFGWLSVRWPDLDWDPAPDDINALLSEERYHSEALGSDRAYAVALPPGYHDPANAEATYPVVFMLHGYGMSPADFLAANVVFATEMAEGLLPKMIVVYVDGRCCWSDGAGTRDCYEPSGKSFGAGWSRECHQGSFYVNQAGDGGAYEDALLELVDHVEATYRVRPPEEVVLP